MSLGGPATESKLIVLSKQQIRCNKTKINLDAKIQPTGSGRLEKGLDKSKLYENVYVKTM